MPFKPEFKVKLLEALHSGRYTQCFGRLRKRNGCTQHCIMGVIADLHNPFGWMVPDATSRHYGDKYGDFEATLDNQTLLDLGLTSHDQACLTGMNDNRFDFLYIADYIEKHL